MVDALVVGRGILWTEAVVVEELQVAVRPVRLTPKLTPRSG